MSVVHAGALARNFSWGETSTRHLSCFCRHKFCSEPISTSKLWFGINFAEQHLVENCWFSEECCSYTEFDTQFLRKDKRRDRPWAPKGGADCTARGGGNTYMAVHISMAMCGCGDIYIYIYICRPINKQTNQFKSIFGVAT